MNSLMSGWNGWERKTYSALLGRRAAALLAVKLLGARLEAVSLRGLGHGGRGGNSQAGDEGEEGNGELHFGGVVGSLVVGLIKVQ